MNRHSTRDFTNILRDTFSSLPMSSQSYIPSTLSATISSAISGLDSKNMSPNTDMYLEGKLLRMYVEIPGCDENSIVIDCSGNKLTITANKIDNNTTHTHTQSYTEILYGRYNRVYTLPSIVVKRNNITASYKNGVLFITINLEPEEDSKFSIRLSETTQ